MKSKRFGRIGIYLSILLAGFLFGLYSSTIITIFQKPTVSVLLPTYNRADVLSSAIESILNQTFKDFELIIIDDGSTDGTASVIEKFIKKDPRIIYLKNEKNEGIVHSLNRGLKKSKGKYIARMDDDDYAFKERLNRQVRAMNEHPEIIVLGTQIGKEPSNKTSQESPKIENPAITQINTYFSSALAHPTIIIRSDFLKKNNIYYSEKYKFAEDCTLYKDILNAGGLISTLQEPLLYFKSSRFPKRPSKYGTIQSDSFKNLQHEKLTQLGVLVDETMLGAYKDIRTKCQLLNEMARANQQTHVLDMDILKDMYTRQCPPNLNQAMLATHPYWKDFFIRINENTLERFSTKDRATIISETLLSMTIKWDKYGIEIYLKPDTQSLFYQQDGDGNIKKKINTF